MIEYVFKFKQINFTFIFESLISVQINLISISLAPTSLQLFLHFVTSRTQKTDTFFVPLAKPLFILRELLKQRVYFSHQGPTFLRRVTLKLYSCGQSTSQTVMTVEFRSLFLKSLQYMHVNGRTRGLHEVNELKCHPTKAHTVGTHTVGTHSCVEHGPVAPS